MGCKLTSAITKENCTYSIAGIRTIYLINLDTAKIKIVDDTKSKEYSSVESITLKDKENAYKIDFIDNTASYTDDLAVNGNGGKYRTHTLNFTLENEAYQILNQGDALSLGRFTAVVIDKSGKGVVLGRMNGLNATSFNYASGAADADATGWTVVMAGTEIEMAVPILNEDVLKGITEETADGMTVED